MTSFDLASLLLLGALAWLWFDSMQARDIGLRAVRAACAVEGLQLLDETMSIAGLKLARDDDGRLLLQRNYRFEYSDTGDNRRSGSLVMLGQEVVAVAIGPGRLLSG